MDVNVYKGFNKKFLSDLSERPLVNNSIEDKFNYQQMNKEYQNKITLAILNGESGWITYEEFELAYDFIIPFSTSGQIKINIINNNIYPGLYPFDINISDEIYEEYKSSKENENKNKPNESIEKLNLLYSDINNIDNHYYCSYYNYEYNNSNINNITNYYNSNFDIVVSQFEDYVVDIGDDLVRYIHHINKILENNYKHISYKLICNTNISNIIFESLKAFCQFNGIISLSKYKSEYVIENTVRSELLDVARNVFKFQNFEFRQLKFYQNPDISKELEEISQGELMEDIVREAENAYVNKPYRDIFMTAPTGAGKSLIFQIPAVYLANKYKKLIIIIEPLKGLMSDQQENLDRCGYKKSAYLNSDIATLTEREKIIEKVKNGEIDLLYVSPETLLSHSIDSLIGEREIGLIIIDEAHIVTTWGVGFRPDYWYLGSYINKLRNSKTKTGANKKYYDFPIFACTATAVNGGKDDTVSETFISLYMRDPIKRIGYAKRDNISFEINNYDDNKSYDRYLNEKVELLGRRINKWIDDKDKTIIYCPYSTIAHQMRNGEKDFRNFDVFKEDIGVYTGGGSDKFEKSEFMAKFKTGEINVMCATKAFGMGIDISDIHNVYHYAVTGGLSDYVQEIGRAARKKDMVGKAIVDYFNGDMKYMNNLFGMSQIRQYQVKKCLSIIYDAYNAKDNRNFLINPKMFNGVFGKNNSDDDTENKLKIVLLMLEKDFYDTFGIYVLISRPGSLFTKTYVSIDKSNEFEVLKSKYGKYFKRIASGRVKEQNGTYSAMVTDIGDIFELDLKNMWEDMYSDMSFALFKYYYFNGNRNVMSEIQGSIYGRVKLNLQAKNCKLMDLYDKAMEEINFITGKLNEFGRTFFTKDEFKEKLMERYKKVSKAEIIANSYFDIVDPLNKCVKNRSTELDETYQISNGNIRSLAESVLRKSSLIRKLMNDDGIEMTQFMLEKQVQDIEALKLLSLFDLIVYEVLGGNTPEIFIRLNAPDKVKNIVEEKVIYKNKYVEMAKEKHYRSVKIIDYFFRNLKNDEDRWNYIERYFLGEDVESEIDNKINEKRHESIVKPISNYIDINNCYSLADFDNWDDVYKSVIHEDKYNYYCNILRNAGIPIPDYAWTTINVNDVQIEPIFIYEDRNILITTEFISYEVEKTCSDNGWVIIKIDEVEKNLEYLKR